MSNSIADPLKSVETVSVHSITPIGYDELDAFTRREQLEEAKANYNREKQVFLHPSTAIELFDTTFERS